MRAEVTSGYAFTVCAPGGYATGAKLEVFDLSGSGDPPLVAEAHLERDGFAVAVAAPWVYVGMMRNDGPELRLFRARGP